MADETEVTGNYSPDFGGALAALKDGKCVARKGWNAHHLLEMRAEDVEFNVLPYISMIIGVDASDLQGKIVPWVASQTDLLASDWMVVVAQAPLEAVK